MMEIDKRLQGKLNRRHGLEFEQRVRRDLEEGDWVVCKWSNNIDLIHDCFVPAKSNRYRMRQGGFPDFLAFQMAGSQVGFPKFIIRFIECKMAKYLNKEEKEKMTWLVEQGFQCFVAFKNEKGNLEYERFGENIKFYGRDKFCRV